MKNDFPMVVTFFVYVVESTSDDDFDVVTEHGDSICIQVDGKHFESDAYHCRTWCDENGFELTIKEETSVIRH